MATSGKPRIGRRKAIAIIGAGVGGAIATAKIPPKLRERKRRKAIVAEHSRLTTAGFGEPGHRREWAHISAAMKGHMSEREQAMKDSYLKALDAMLRKTMASINERRSEARRENNDIYLKALKEITPIDIVRIMHGNPPSASQSSFSRLRANTMKRRLKKKSGAEAAGKYPEIVRLENASAVCDAALKLDKRLVNQLHSILHRIPKSEFDRLLRETSTARP